MNRARHFPTVCLARPISPATTVLVLPSEQPRMIPGSQSQRLGSGWTPLPALEALAFVGGKVQGRNGASDGHGDLHERFVEGTPQQVLLQCFHNSGH